VSIARINMSICTGLVRLRGMSMISSSSCTSMAYTTILASQPVGLI
jgi:hypothetical protein